MGNKTNGLLALLGLGALAWWKYKKSSPEEQQKIKDQINTAKDNLNKWGNELKSKAEDVASQVQNKANEFAAKTENKGEEVRDEAQKAINNF
ncbi:MAG: YtxH domain-containing protein [Cruoricaptor ignavus]|nr:YtxH domain-containing protein [Cruoricaptor ignavus]